MCRSFIQLNALTSKALQCTALGLSFFISATFLTGCMSTDAAQSDGALVSKLSLDLEALKKDLKESAAAKLVTDERLALFQVEISSLKAQLATGRRHWEIQKRPGLNTEVESHLAMPPDLGPASTNQSVPFEGKAVPHQTTAGAPETAKTTEPGEEHESNPIPDSASKPLTVADAELKMRKANYGEAVVILAQIQRETPNLSDGGHSALLLAECWLNLNQPENALPILRGFYLKYPQSGDSLKAKLLEGRVLEKSGAREKAVGVYREIVALGPNSIFAREARTALGRMRDAR